MLNLKECTYQLYQDEIGSMKPIIQKRIRQLYNSRDKYLAYTAILVYAAYSAKMRRTGADLDNVLEQIDRQAKVLDGTRPENMVEAMSIVSKFNKMNIEYFRYKRTCDMRMPYITFQPCFWYFDAIRLLQEVNKEEYPLVGCWQEFFLFLPITIAEEAGSNYEGIKLSIADYIKAVRAGKFERWYRENKGYGGRKSPFARGTYRDMYAEELADMSPAELHEEMAKGNWGFGLVKAEMEKRTNG
jgi:hypothetical protein